MLSLTSSTSSCVYDVVHVTTTVNCGCQPIHNETSYHQAEETPYLKKTPPTVEDQLMNTSTATHVILTAYFFKAIQLYSLYAILQPHLELY